MTAPSAAVPSRGWPLVQPGQADSLPFQQLDWLPRAWAGRPTLLLSGLLVALPVFVEAPWVRHAPFSAVLFTAVLLAVGLALACSRRPGLGGTGEVLVGFSGSWLAGALFWGWARQHPICHLPLEALALPLALAGLNSRWRLAGGFYLGSLLGTAATDAAIAATGLMPLWPLAVNAEPGAAPELLRHAASTLLQPMPLLLVLSFGLGLTLLSRWLWTRGPVARVAATALATTLVVDALFLVLALLAPGLSGLI
jgi:hypothetical protein